MTKIYDQMPPQTDIEEQLIRERKKAHEAMVDLKIVLDNISVGLIYINRNYTVQWESTKCIAPLFSDKAYIKGQICYKTVFQRDTPCEVCALSEVFATGKPASHNYQQGDIVVEVSANPIFDSNEELIGGIIKVDDISDRMKQENKIKELNHVMDAILNNIPIYLFVKDPANEFRYLYWNKAMADNTKIPVEKVLGKTDYEVFPSVKNADKFRADDLALLRQGDKIEFQEDYMAADGQMRTVNTVKALIPSENAVPWIIGLSWDITNIKQTEKELIVAKDKAEQSNRLKSAFLANMSHEIRTPLNAIVGFSDLLVDTTDKQERYEYIDIIKKNNDLLLQLISDILDLSKIEAQSLEFIYEKVDVNVLCSGVVAAANLKIDVRVPVIFDRQISDCYIYSDENRVNQVISNLVSNAVKFTFKGCIKVGYNVISDTEIEFYVEDTGTGIAVDQIDNVFERFVKLDVFAQGTGLGLPICKSIIEQLNGRIGVESEQGVGSRFWFTLPYDKSPGIEPVKPEPQIITKKVHYSSSDQMPTILVAEDIDSNYLLLDSILKCEYRLVRARDGVEAVAMSETCDPDMILMDIKMPNMDGLEATRKIRERDTTTPILALTAFAFDSDIQTAKTAGCNDVISKPIAITLLKTKIQEYLR